MYQGYITDVPGIEVGHAQNYEAMTGCSVILTKKGAVGGVDVRGSAPGTRETDLFGQKKTVNQVHAIVLAGGSAFGLDAAGGVMKYLEEEGVGYQTPVIKVPIVSSAVIFDLGLGSSRIRPDYHMGYLAAKNAKVNESLQGNIGAGTGASVGKILGPNYIMKTGLGSASVKLRSLVVGALVVLNAMGDVFDRNQGEQIAGVYDRQKKHFLKTSDLLRQFHMENAITNTTIACIATNARFDKEQTNKLAEMTHNAFARTIAPVHTSSDGDTIFALATQEVMADLNLVGVMAIEAMEKAIMNAVYAADAYQNFPAYQNIFKP